MQNLKLIINSYLNKYPLYFYIILFLLTILILYFFSLNRLQKNKINIILIISFLFFPFSLTYNKVYYTFPFKGMLIIFLVTLVYFLFYKSLENLNFNLYSIFFVFTSSMLLRLGFIFILLFLTLSTYLFLKLIINKKYKDFFFILLFAIILLLLLFLILKTSLYDYFMIKNFKPENISKIVYHFYEFPRERPLLLIIFIYLIFINLLLVFKASVNKKILFILVPEILIFLVLQLLYSDGNLTTTGIYLGLFPFAALNIFYFYSFIDKISQKNRYIFLTLFSIICLIENINGIIFRFIQNKIY